VLKTKVSFLDEVEEVHALWEGVTARDRHNKTQVCANEAVFRCGCVAKVASKRRSTLASVNARCGVATSFDCLGELALVFGGEQGNLADVI
jgi:hypothetical protein